MTYANLSALALFAFVSSITPGPNNLMLMASGANFGVLRTVPHMLGVALGFGFMLFLVGLGLGQVFAHVPALDLAMKIFAAAYMLWLAWRIANAGRPGEGHAAARPLGFFQAAAFQWVNPKALAMALGSMALYAPDGSPGSVLWVCGVFVLINLPCISIWAMAGKGVRKWLKDGWHLRAFNWLMATLLVGSLVMVLH